MIEINDILLERWLIERLWNTDKWDGQLLELRIFVQNMISDMYSEGIINDTESY